MLVKNYKYTIYGILTGLFFILIVWIVGAYYANLTFSINSFIFLHKIYPVYWFIDLLPLVIGFIAFFIEQETYKVESQLDVNLRRETNKSEKVLDFVNNLISDNFETSYSFSEDNDKLGETLIELRDKLKHSKEEESLRRKEDDQRNWISEGLAKFSEILRQNNNDLETLSYNLIISLIKYLGANQGGFFLVQETKNGEKYFQQSAAYAYERKKFANKRVEWGEGLIGTAALEKKIIFLTEVPDGYLNITSGLGKANPRCVIIVPLIFSNEIHGAMELASFKRFEKFEIDFVEKISESIASTLSGVKINLRTSELLKESREQAEILATQEEQMRQNMEELQATQEEAARQSEKFISFTNSVADFDRHTSHLSFAEIAKGALAFMADRLHIGRASIALLRPEGDGFRVYDATVNVQGVESGTIVPHGSGTLSETVDQKRAIYRADIRDWPAKNALDQAFISHGFLSTISVPLMSGGRCKGTLNAAASRVDGIDLATRQVIELVAPRLTYAFEMGIALDALAESEARFRDVFDTVGDGIVVADVSNRKIVMVNAPMCALLGRSSAELLKLTIEYRIMDVFAVRVGHSMVNAWTFGCGVALLKRQLGFDFAYLTHELAPTYQLSVTYRR